MRAFLLLVFSGVLFSGLAAAEESSWVIVKREPGKKGWQEVVVRNRSDQPLELVGSWNFADKAKANVGVAPEEPVVPGSFVLPATMRKLFSECCHQRPDPTHLKVKPGATVRVVLPEWDFGGFDKKRMVLLLTEKGGKVVEAGRLFPEAGKGEEE